MHFRRCCFTINFIVAFVTFYGLMILIDKLPGLSFSFSVLLILPLLIAATIEGKAFAKQKSSRPAVKNCWLASFKMMLLVWLSVFALVLVRIASNPDSLTYLMTIDMHSFALVLGVCSVAGWLLIHTGYAIGLASELKGQQTSHQY